MSEPDLVQCSIRQSVFTLDRGVASVQWPAEMSAEDYRDFKDWLEIILRMVGRTATATAPEPSDEEYRDA